MYFLIRLLNFRGDDNLLYDITSFVNHLPLCFTPQEAWPMAADGSFLQPQEQRRNTAALLARALPYFPPAANFSRHHGYAMECRMWCHQEEAAFWRTSGIIATPICSSETSLDTLWSLARISMAAGMQRFVRLFMALHVCVNWLQIWWLECQKCFCFVFYSKSNATRHSFVEVVMTVTFSELTHEFWYNWLQLLACCFLGRCCSKLCCNITIGSTFTKIKDKCSVYTVFTWGHSKSLCLGLKAMLEKHGQVNKLVLDKSLALIFGFNCKCFFSIMA